MTDCIRPDDSLATAVVTAIRIGDVSALKRLLAEHADLAAARIGGDDSCGQSRTLSHVATDWLSDLRRGVS